MRKMLSEMKAVGSVEPGMDAEVGSLPSPLTSTDTPIAPPAASWLPGAGALDIASPDVKNWPLTNCEDTEDTNPQSVTINSTQ